MNALIQTISERIQSSYDNCIDYLHPKHNEIQKLKKKEIEKKPIKQLNNKNNKKKYFRRTYLTGITILTSSGRNNINIDIGNKIISLNKKLIQRFKKEAKKEASKRNIFSGIFRYTRNDGGKVFYDFDNNNFSLKY